jgi:hypothetical protein
MIGASKDLDYSMNKNEGFCVQHPPYTLVLSDIIGLPCASPFGFNGAGR